jgi:hypothetical protein
MIGAGCWPALDRREADDSECSIWRSKLVMWEVGVRDWV